jgi:hypothetical protein
MVGTNQKQLVLQHVSRNLKCWDRRGRHRMKVGFTTTCAISAHRNLHDRHDITEILLKVVLNTINQPTNHKMFPETLQEYFNVYVFSSRFAENFGNCILFAEKLQEILKIKLQKRIAMSGNA